MTTGYKTITMEPMKASAIRKGKAMVAMAVIAVAMSWGVTAEPPATVRCRGLRFELTDGTVITGRIDTKVITIRMSSGNVLKVPVAELTELTVGLKGQQGTVERSKQQSKIMTRDSTLIGAVAVEEFRITSPYGTVTVKLDAVQRICPAVKAGSGKLGQWVVDLRGKSRLKGMLISRYLRVRTPYGTMVVPFAYIQTVSFTADGKSIRIQCWNSDQIVGTLARGTAISFKAEKGKVDISASKIAAMAYGTLTLDLGKGVNMKLVPILGGQFLMGSKLLPSDEVRRRSGKKPKFADKYPQRKVTISRLFYMGVYEVTQSQWRAVMGTEPWDDELYTKSGRGNAASYISWDDASEFCEMLSKKTGKRVLLPTEAQWEYACRAGSVTAYCFGDDASKLGDYAWYYDNAWKIGEEYAHVVGRKKANAWGLHDMHGNVWEWCRDWYDKKFYAKAQNVDPENTTASTSRVIRGGTYDFYSRSCRSAVRTGLTPGIGGYVTGFRVVVESNSGMD